MTCRRRGGDLTVFSVTRTDLLSSSSSSVSNNARIVVLPESFKKCCRDCLRRPPLRPPLNCALLPVSTMTDSKIFYRKVVDALNGEVLPRHDRLFKVDQIPPPSLALPRTDYTLHAPQNVFVPISAVYI